MQIKNHPIYGRDYLIDTDPVMAMMNSIQTWILIDLLGAYLFGYPRVGKTHFMSRTRGRFRTRSGQIIPVVCFDEPALAGVTDRQLWLAAVSSCKLIYHARLNTRDLLLLLLAHLLELAAQTAERRIVIYIDEAQDLSKAQLLLYRSLMNQLVKENVSPLFVLVGSDEMPEFVKAYESVTNAHIHGRFFNAHHEVKGLANVEQVKRALAHYDGKLRYEQGRSCWTEDFLPQSFAAGLRLADHAQKFWNCFTTLYPYYGKTGWPMQSFVVTVRNLFDLLRDENQIPERAIEAALRSSPLMSYGKTV